MYPQATTTYGSLIPGAEYIRSLVRQGRVSKEAAKRLRWMDYYARCGNARQTCRYFGISAQTFYRWKNRYDPYELTTLEEESRRPRHVRQPETPENLRERISALREEYPRWNRDKLAVLLEREGIVISGSTVGRVMNKLKARGLLVEPENMRQAKLARKSPGAAMGIKVAVLFLVLEGQRPKWIIDILGLTRQSLNNWMHNVNERGVAALKALPRPGRPTQLNEKIQRAEFYAPSSSG